MRNPWTESSYRRRVLGLTCVCLLLSTSRLLAAGGTRKFIMQNDLKIVDPYWTTAYVTRNYGYMIYDTLFSKEGGYDGRPLVWMPSSCG